MAIGLNSLMNMGNGALSASQAAINTTGNNIANVNTAGYSRQAVRLEQASSIDSSPGQIGQGVRATEVFRYFDRFIEKSYLDKFSSQTRFEEQNGILLSIQNLFNESNTPGISSLFDKFMKDWQAIGSDPSSLAARSALVANTSNFTRVIKDTDESMYKIQVEIDKQVEANVGEANRLIKQIADLNNQIKIHDVPGSNNANSLMDARDQATRSLASIIDIDVIDRGGGTYNINTKSGKNLVDGGEYFGLKFQAGETVKDLQASSSYAGNAKAVGSDYNEYTLEMVVAETGSAPAQFRASLDGGRTWVQNDDGSTRLYDASNDPNNPVKVHNVAISFSEDTSKLSVGDKFTIIPKNAVYYDHPTKGLENITPLIYGDGSDNENRITGGVLGGLLVSRDYEIGKFRDKLQAFSQSLTWEVNRMHSQGAGLEKLNTAMGTYTVRDSGMALGADSSDLVWKDRLNQLANVKYDNNGQVSSVDPGNVTFYVYDNASGDPLKNMALNFSGLSSGHTSAYGNGFDPTVHSLKDVAEAINDTFGDTSGGTNYLTATIVDGRLQVVSSDPSKYSFGMVDDTSGVLAALGINTFFKGGDTPNTIAMRDEIGVNLNIINAGRINGGGEINSGDNSTARAIGNLATEKVYLKSSFERATSQSLGSYYGGLVSLVGSNTASSAFNAAVNRTMASDLDARQDEIGGVNLDEEMSNLIKFQSSYKAAAKLITTADQMLQTILSLKN